MAIGEEGLAESQRCFRHANNRLRDRVRALVAATYRVPFLCECTNDLCFAPVAITVAEYDRIRDGACLFVVVTGHPRLASEGIVSENERFTVVQNKAA
jgi:hypothetical protein